MSAALALFITAIVTVLSFFALVRITRARRARRVMPLASSLTLFEAVPPWAHRIRWLTVVLTASPWVLLNVVRHLPAGAIFIVIGLYGLIALPMLLPQKVGVGNDGVVLRWAGRRKFISFATIRNARTTALGVELDLEGAQQVEIRLTHRDGEQTARAAALLRTIEDGMVEHQSVLPADDEMLLARNDRTVPAWLDAMKRLADADAHGYRTMSIPRERLWAIIENAAANPSAREGAVLAVHQHLDAEEKERLQAIAEKSASPRLRVAIEAVTLGHDVEQRLVEIEERVVSRA